MNNDKKSPNKFFMACVTVVIVLAALDVFAGVNVLGLIESSFSGLASFF